MHILLIHNRYQQPGGEDQVFEAEKDLLNKAGHEVSVYERHNDEIKNCSIINKIGLTRQTIWSKKSFQHLLSLLKQERPGIVHFHNTFPLISPAAYYACKEARVPVVQTLHNYRLLCPAATFYRNGNVCEDCLGKNLPWPGILYGCYRDSLLQTSVMATMLAIHRCLKTWKKKVYVYIALTDFARQKSIEGGLPAEKIVVKPNFVSPDPGVGEDDGSYALFVGRLSPEKGLITLLSAWRHLKDIPLKIAGDGPLKSRILELTNRREAGDIEIMGRKSIEEVLSLMKGAGFLIFPSEWYETFGRVAIESFACGVPVIASRLGAMAEIVEDGRTGLYFNSGDPEDLAAKVEWAWTHPDEMKEMGREGRREYEEKYTAKRNYEMLMETYERAIEMGKRR